MMEIIRDDKYLNGKNRKNDKTKSMLRGGRQNIIIPTSVLFCTYSPPSVRFYANSTRSSPFVLTLFV